MAKAPKDPNAPKKPRSIKPSKFFLMYKGSITDMRLVRTADDALELKDADPSWEMKRLVVPKGKKPGTVETPTV